MTNKEHVLKYLNEHEDELVDVISELSCCFCGAIGLIDYCRSTSDDSCSNTIKAWLSMEHTEPLLFPIGTMVEVNDHDSLFMGYYNGFENGKHYIVHYKHFIGYRYRDGELYGGKYDADQLRKVGDNHA